MLKFYGRSKLFYFLLTDRMLILERSVNLWITFSDAIFKDFYNISLHGNYSILKLGTGQKEKFGDILYFSSCQQILCADPNQQ